MDIGIHKNISNEEYHADTTAISCTQIKQLGESVEKWLWYKTAPVVKSKLDTLNFGSAAHAVLLEPENIKNEFYFIPELLNEKNQPVNKNTNDYKAHKAACEKEAAGKTILTYEQYIKLQNMHDSALAHPRINYWLTHPNRIAESSICWLDEATGIKCKCRPDLIIPDLKIAIDIKTIADINKIQYSIEDYKYYVQEPFYLDGIESVYGPEWSFYFVFISTTINCGRYDVDYIQITDDDSYSGKLFVDSALKSLKDYNNSGVYEQTIKIVGRPYYANQNNESAEIMGVDWHE